MYCSDCGESLAHEDECCPACGLCWDCCWCDELEEGFDVDEMGVDPESADDEEIRKYGA